MGRYDDDYRYEQRRQDRIADERRYEQRRQDALAEERRRDDRRRDYIDQDNRRLDREDREKSQMETNDLAMSWLRLGNAEAAAATWGLNLNLDRAPAPDRRPGPTERLGAPRLDVADDFLARSTVWSWTAVAGATGYLLQESASPAFFAPVELYRGDLTQYARPRLGPDWVPPLLRSGLPFRAAPFPGNDFCRVKALGGSEALDSPWSNVV